MNGPDGGRLHFYKSFDSSSSLISSISPTWLIITYRPDSRDKQSLTYLNKIEAWEQRQAILSRLSLCSFSRRHRYIFSFPCQEDSWLSLVAFFSGPRPPGDHSCHQLRGWRTSKCFITASRIYLKQQCSSFVQLSS